MSVADDRSELLNEQRRARVQEHRRRQAARAAEVVSMLPIGNTPKSEAPRPSPRVEIELAQIRRTIWLAVPVVIPGTQRRVFAYDPENCPEWLVGMAT